MKNKTELINILKAELTLLAQEIIRDIHKKDIKDIYKNSRKLYEKTNAIHQLSKLMDQKSLEELFLEENGEEPPVKDEPFLNQHVVEVENQVEKQSYNEVPVPQEMRKKEKAEGSNIYKSVTNMKFIPKKEEEKLKIIDKGEFKEMNIGLNDKIAFIRHLFNNDSTTYNKVIQDLNNFDSYETALSYLNNEVKPKFNNWENKDEYEFRLIQLLELKFN